MLWHKLVRGSGQLEHSRRRTSRTIEPKTSTIVPALTGIGAIEVNICARDNVPFTLSRCVFKRIQKCDGKAPTPRRSLQYRADRFAGESD
jgi:hypothetical protein